MKKFINTLLTLILIFTTSVVIGKLKTGAAWERDYEMIVKIDGITYATASYFSEDSDILPKLEDDRYYVIGFEQEYDEQGDPLYTEIAFPDEIDGVPVVCVDTDDFAKHTEITSVSFSKNMIGVHGYTAFAGCTGLSSLSFPEKMRYIGMCAFQDCTGLTEVMFPKELQTLDAYAFSGCTNLKRIVIPEKTKKIDYHAFFNCTSLSSVEFMSTTPEQIDFGKHVFKNTALLNEKKEKGEAWIVGKGHLIDGSGLQGDVTFTGDTVTSIANYAFIGNKKIKKVTIKNIDQIGIRAFAKSGAVELVVKNVEYIGNEAFTRSNIKKSNIKNVSQMGTSIFKGCRNLRVCTVSGVTNIPYGTFYRCTKLNKVTLGKATKTIGASVFSTCRSLKIININSSKKIIWEQSKDAMKHKSFTNFYKCKSLKKINLKSGKVSRTIKKAGIPKTVKLNVPNNKKAKYKKYVDCKIT